jgi:hypothetical protein
MPFDPHDEVTDAEVKKAAGAAPDAPSNDVQAVLYAHATLGLTTAEAVLSLVNIALVQKGVNEGDAADWAKAGAMLGPDVVKGLVKLAALLA